MKYFLNIAYNLSLETYITKSRSGIISSHAFVIAFMSPNFSANQTSIQIEAKSGINQAQFTILTKNIKYCIYYKQDYHTKLECRDKYPYLQDKSKSTKPQLKWR